MPVGCITFEPTGPSMFRGPMEFTPTVRGPQTLARTLTLPSPSTVAGSLATLLIDKGISSPARNPTDWEDALELVLELGEESCLKGPYLLVDEEIYVPFQDGVVKLEELVRAIKEADIEKLIHEGRSLDNIIMPMPLKRVEHVGIGLRRATKAVERGFLYSADFVDLPSTFPGRKVFIAVDVHGATALNNLSVIEDYVMRFGGEGKVVRIKVRERSYLWEEVGDMTAKVEQHRALLYLISPALLRTPLTSLVPITSAKAPMLVIDGFELELLTGRIEILGAGFDILRGIRKPMYASLMSGSLLEAQIEQGSLVRLYRKGISHIGNRLCYGTFIPIT